MHCHECHGPLLPFARTWSHPSGGYDNKHPFSCLDTMSHPSGGYDNSDRRAGLLNAVRNKPSNGWLLIAGALLALAGCAQSDLDVWEQEQVRLQAEQPQENADRLECLSLAQQIDPLGQVSVPGSLVYVQCMQTKRAQRTAKSN